MKQELTRFHAKSKEGITYIVIEYAELIKPQYLNDQTPIFKGQREWFLLDGRSVLQVDADTFQILNTDETIRKIGDGEF